MKRDKEKDFFRKPYKETLIAIVNKFGDVSSRLLGYLDASCTYHNELVVLPPAKEIARIIGCGLSTIYNAFTKIEEKCNFFRIQLSGTHILAYRTDPDNPKNFFDFKNQEYIPTQKNFFLKYKKDSQNLESQSPEPVPDKNRDSPQTLQTDLDLPDGEEVKNNSESEKPRAEVDKSVSSGKQKYDVLPGHQNLSTKTKLPQVVTSKKYDIPEELMKRLEALKIPLSEQVRVAIAKHHISQAYGAVSWVENSWGSIRDPKAIFLFQLPKQPIERLGQLYPDSLLEKQKREIEAIEEERKNGIPPLPKGFQAVKQRLLDKKNTNPRMLPKGET